MPVVDLHEAAVDVVLEVRRRLGEVEREVERAAFLGEILLELCDRGGEERGPGLPWLVLAGAGERSELDPADSGG
jgi:hypothetical protein